MYLQRAVSNWPIYLAYGLPRGISAALCVEGAQRSTSIREPSIWRINDMRMLGAQCLGLESLCSAIGRRHGVSSVPGVIFTKN